MLFLERLNEENIYKLQGDIRHLLSYTENKQKMNFLNFLTVFQDNGDAFLEAFKDM